MPAIEPIWLDLIDSNMLTSNENAGIFSSSILSNTYLLMGFRTTNFRTYFCLLIGARTTSGTYGDHLFFVVLV